MVTLSQEVVSVGVLVIVCASLSVLCALVWIVRCRKGQERYKEERERQRDIDSYKDKQVNKSFAKRAVADKPAPQPKRAESVLSNQSKTDSVKDSVSTINEEMPANETIAQYEARVTQNYVSRPLERIKEECTPVKNKRLETASITASYETLQRNDSKVRRSFLLRNDSKVNVFPADKMEEIDLNPGLNTSVINLDTI